MVSLLLCYISQIATGVPCSESPRNKSQIAPILIKRGCNLTCFGPVQSFNVLILIKRKVGVACLQGAFKTMPNNGGGHMSSGCFQHREGWGSHVLRVLSNIEFCALAPDLFIIHFRLPYKIIKTSC
jgi:hypothetical protein